MVELSTPGSSFEVDGLLSALHQAIGSVNWSDQPVTVMTTAASLPRLWSKRYRFLRAICVFGFLTVFVFLERLAAVLLRLRRYAEIAERL